MKFKDNRQGSLLISMLIALLIIGLILWVSSKRTRDRAHDSLMQDANIDTSSYKSIIDSARKVAADASKAKQ